MKASPNGQTRAVTNNRPNVQPPAPHTPPLTPKVLQRNVAGNRQAAIRPAGVQSKAAPPKIVQAKVSRNPPPMSQMTPRIVQRHPAKPTMRQAGAGRSVQLSMSRVIQRKGKYFVDGKQVSPKPLLTDGRVWSEDKEGDFHAIWPMAPYVSWHDKRRVPTAQSYSDLGLDPSRFGPPRCVGERMIVVGIPYRDDAFGISLRKDAMLVRFGTGCSVRILHGPPAKFGEQVDALYIPGAPYDLPNTKLVTDKQVPKSKPQEEEWQHRLALQEAWLRWADENNKPVLGVCGGSRRQAQFSGGATSHLSKRAQRMHRGNFNEPNVIAHQVIIKGDSQLGKLLLSGNYRALGPEVQQGLLELVHSGAITHKGGNIILDVNSMHWAQSVFPQSASNIALSAYAHGDPDHTLEGWSRLDRPFWIGVQWHPEYAQTGMGDFHHGKSKPHANIMKGLGQAATEDYAVRIIQSVIRTALARREFHERQRVEESSSVTTTSSLPSVSLRPPLSSPSMSRSDEEYVPPLRPPSSISIVGRSPSPIDVVDMPHPRIVNRAPISRRQLETIYGPGMGIWEYDG